MILRKDNWIVEYLFPILFVAIILLFYLIKLISLQIINNEMFSIRSNRIIYRQDIIPAQRGRIYDRNFEIPLADNKEVFQIKLDYSLFPTENKIDILSLIEEGCGVPYIELLNTFENGLKNNENSVTLIDNALFKHIVFISEHKEELPGIYYATGLIREYNNVSSLSHILGYLGKITANEYRLMASHGYNIESFIGRQGVEKEYDLLLRGEDGIQQRTVDFKERTVSEHIVKKRPKPGNDLVLTIDSRIQTLCEKALGQRSGSVVVMKPHNGEIVAMVSWPWYDNNFNTKSNRIELYREYQMHPRYPLINRAIQSKYAPASTFKLIMSAAILDSQLLDPQKKINCPGFKRVGNRVFHCHYHSGHGMVNLDDAISESCNVYFYTAGYEYLKDPNLIKNYANGFNYGRLTNIDLPSETDGLVPDPKWLKLERNLHWVGGDTVNMSIGQGNLLVTPLQLACAVSMICNDGVLMQPHLLKEFRDPYTHKEVSTFEPKVLSNPEWNKEIFKAIRLGMRHVITKGTARYVISTKAVNSAGKTGTAEVGKEDSWHSWYVGFAPYDAPVEEQYVIVVMVEADNKWEFWSAKACNVILQGIFAHQNYDETIKVLGSWYGS